MKCTKNGKRFASRKLNKLGVRFLCYFKYAGQGLLLAGLKSGLEHLLDVELNTLPGDDDSVPIFGAGAYPFAVAATAAVAAVAP